MSDMYDAVIGRRVAVRWSSGHDRTECTRTGALSDGSGAARNGSREWEE